MHSNPYFFNVYPHIHTHTQYSTLKSRFPPIILDKSQRRLLSLALVVKPRLLYPALPCTSYFGYVLTLLALQLPFVSCTI